VTISGDIGGLAPSPAIRPPARGTAAPALVIEPPSTRPALPPSAGFLAQVVVQEKLPDGLDLPRWRERSLAYTPPARAGGRRLLIEA
jgi:hypothetical protein